jgi:two-component system nitrogen regulation response regulator GlnG
MKEKPQSRQARILIVDDEEALRWALQKALEKKGYRVQTLPDGDRAIQEVSRDRYDVVLMDIKMPTVDGITALKKIKEVKPRQFVILMTAYGTMRTAIDAMKEGAFDYITKPFNFDEVCALIEKALLHGSYHQEVKYLSHEMSEAPAYGNIIGRSLGMQRVYRLIGLVAPTDLNVLIQGDSGTGKELVAKAIHYFSRRSDRPFVVVNTAAIPPNLLESELFGHEKGAFTGAVATKIGKFQLADGGTIFLDEIGDMDVLSQSKILRVLQEREFYRVGGGKPIRVDVRILAATNKDLDRVLEEQKFRKDLYYRLNTLPIKVPRLRDRREDIPLLIDFFLSKFCVELNIERKHLSKEAARLLMEYDWPGNVRELENTLRRAMILAPSNILMVEHFPPVFREKSSGAGSALEHIERVLGEKITTYIETLGKEGQGDLHSILMRRFEQPLIRETLERTRGNKRRAAELLGINRNTLNKKLKELKIP